MVGLGRPATLREAVLHTWRAEDIVQQSVLPLLLTVFLIVNSLGSFGGLVLLLLTTLYARLGREVAHTLQHGGLGIVRNHLFACVKLFEWGGIFLIKVFLRLLFLVWGQDLVQEVSRLLGLLEVGAIVRVQELLPVLCSSLFHILIWKNQRIAEHRTARFYLARNLSGVFLSLLFLLLALGGRRLLWLLALLALVRLHPLIIGL